MCLKGQITDIVGLCPNKQAHVAVIAMVETEHFTGKINASFVRFRFSLWPAAFPAHEFLISLIPVNRAITQDLTRAFT